jgi:hypothetical protein
LLPPRTFDTRELQRSNPDTTLRRVLFLTARADLDCQWQKDGALEDAGPGRLVITGAYVRRIREKTGLTQDEFDERFGLSLRTVQEWEQGRAMPEGPARVLLAVIKREPDAVVRALTPEPPFRSRLSCCVEMTTVSTRDLRNVDVA